MYSTKSNERKLKSNHKIRICVQKKTKKKTKKMKKKLSDTTLGIIPKSNRTIV